MPLHLIKLAVGCDSVRELKEWVAERMATAKKKGLPLRHVHITRMTPKREEEILAGGSLYWVIRGEIAAREKIIAIEPFLSTGAEWVDLAPDGWTLTAEPGTLTVQYEHTVVATKRGPLVVTAAA